MTTKITTEEYLIGAAQGTAKLGNFAYQKKPNIFWYEPTLFTIGMYNLKATPEAFSGGYSLKNVDPKKISLDVQADFRLGNTTFTQNITGIKMTHLYPNKSYLSPYTIFKRRHYTGVAIQFPIIDDTAVLSLTETWHVAKDLIKSYALSKDKNPNDKAYTFTRIISFPLKASDTIKPFNFEVNKNNVLNHYAWSNDYYCTRDTDRLHYAVMSSHNSSQEIISNKTFSRIGSQTMGLSHLEIPKIIFDIERGFALTDKEIEDSRIKELENKGEFTDNIFNQIYLCSIYEPPKFEKRLLPYTHNGYGNYAVKIDEPKDTFDTKRYDGTLNLPLQLIPNIATDDPDFQELCLEYQICKVR